jgi:hypothetical protein
MPRCGFYSTDIKITRAGSLRAKAPAWAMQNVPSIDREKLILRAFYLGIRISQKMLQNVLIEEEKRAERYLRPALVNSMLKAKVFILLVM